MGVEVQPNRTRMFSSNPLTLTPCIAIRDTAFHSKPVDPAADGPTRRPPYQRHMSRTSFLDSASDADDGMGVENAAPVPV